MKRVATLLWWAMLVGVLLASSGCASNSYGYPYGGSYYPAGTIHSDAYPQTYGRGYGYYGYGGYGRPGRYGYY